MKVSVIVPAYNSEKTIKRCLDSLLNQSFKDIEIIVINDGSNDQTKEILKSYVNYDNILIFNTENHGQSAARNLGLDKASGDYICFVDSDDYVSDNGLEMLYNKAISDDFDIVLSDVNIVYPDHNVIVNSGLKGDTFDKNKIKELMIFSYSAGVIWNKIYKRKLLDNIRFKEDVWYEDVHFNFRLFPRLKKIGTINEVFVNYVQTEGSVTYTYNDKLYDIIKVFNDLIEYYKKNDLYDSYFSELEYSYVRYAYNTFVKRLTKCKNYKKFMDGVRYAKAEVKKHFPKYRKNYYYWHYRSIGALLNSVYFIFFNRIFASIIYVVNKNKMN